MTNHLPRNGLTVRELSKRTGVSTASIIRWTSEPRAVYLSRAKKRREKIRGLRAKGLTIRAIAAELGCSVGTVHKAISTTKESV